MILNLIKLCRPQQWYKNLLVFLALVFSENLFNAKALILSLLAFFSLCFVSSSNYAINDIFDLRQDRKSSEKKHRPIASGNVPIKLGAAFSIFLFLFGALIAYFFVKKIFLSLLIFFLIQFLYSLALKKIFLIDIITISIAFVLRAAIGGIAIGVEVSQWLVLGIFFLALFLVAGKRYSESLLNEQTREVMRFYSKEFLNFLLSISTTLLLITFALYTFFSKYKALIVTLPLAVYLIFLYLSKILQGDKVARMPELIFKDLKFLLAFFSWIFLVLMIIYF